MSVFVEHREMFIGTQVSVQYKCSREQGSVSWKCFIEISV